MPVMIDQQPLAAESLGYATVGHVLTHVRRQKRLVINLLIDGRVPDLSKLADVQQSHLTGRSVFIETASPAEMAAEVLDEVQASLADADRVKADAADLLSQDKIAPAMAKLGVFFSTWQAVQDSVAKTTQLLGLSTDQVRVDGQPLEEVMAEFTGELRTVRQALQDRDYVLLGDLLSYETSESTGRWNAVIETLRDLAG